MNRRTLLCGIALLGLGACGGRTRRAIGADGLPVRTVYRIEPGAGGDIQFRMLDGINALRSSAGVPPVRLDSALNAAAATHSRDMSLQNRPWNFGSDGSSPIDRARRAGYSGRLVGEAISETFESELETLAAWMEDVGSRSIILAPEARAIGLGWFQEPAGKIWWTLEVGA